MFIISDFSATPGGDRQEKKARDRRKGIYFQDHGKKGGERGYRLLVLVIGTAERNWLNIFNSTNSISLGLFP